MCVCVCVCVCLLVSDSFVAVPAATLCGVVIFFLYIDSVDVKYMLPGYCKLHSARTCFFSSMYLFTRSWMQLA